MPQSSIVMLSDPDGLAAESFRSLRATVELLGEKDHRALLFTSAVADEGKSFTSCNYAVSLAQSGLRTLLIDADLRCPSVHDYFRLSESTMGLVDHVTTGVALSKVIVTNVVPGLDVLLRGAKCSNPAELLSETGIKKLIAESVAKYDRVIIDTPPINFISDALLIAPHVRSVCLVVRAGSTSKRTIQRALSTLNTARIKPAGMVLNQIDLGRNAMMGYVYGDQKYGRAYARG